VRSSFIFGTQIKIFESYIYGPLLDRTVENRQESIGRREGERIGKGSRECVSNSGTEEKQLLNKIFIFVFYALF